MQDKNKMVACGLSTVILIVAIAAISVVAIMDRSC